MESFGADDIGKGTLQEDTENKTAPITEFNALQILDEARAALREIRELATTTGLADIVAAQEEVCKNDGHSKTKSEVELQALSRVVEATIPNTDTHEKHISRLSMAERRSNAISQDTPGAAPPPPTPHMEITPTHLPIAAISVVADTGMQQPKRRWGVLKRLFNRNKINKS